MSTTVSDFWSQSTADKLGVESDVSSGSHHVTAVVVAHNGARWLPRVLESLEQSTRRPDELIAVDTGSTDKSATILADSTVVDQTIKAPVDAGFGQAIVLGLADSSSIVDITDGGPEVEIDLRDTGSRADPLARADAPGLEGATDTEGLLADSESGTTEWVWLLHDDTAVAPAALTGLLACADDNPDAWVIGPKVHRWKQTEVLLECGVSYTAFGRRITGIEGRELDQGQYDGRLDVLAVSSAGMLVKRDIWNKLGGFTSSLPIFGDDQDFCYRVQRSGGRVVVATNSVVYHRQAAATGRRDVSAGPHSTVRAQRRATNLNVLAHVPFWRLPFSMFRLAVTGVLGFVLALLGLTAGTAWDHFASAVGPILSIRALWRARRKVSRTKSVSRRDVRRTRRLIGRNGSYWQEAVPRFLDHGSRSSQQSIRQRGRVLAHWIAAVFVPTFLVSFVAMRSLWFGAGQVQGGALLPATDSAVNMWAGFLGSWHEVGLGSDVAAPPLLAVLSGTSLVFFGSTTAAVQVILLLAPVLAASSAFFAMRGLVSGLPRAAGAVAFGLLPATVAAIGTGRLATAVVAILLPLVGRGLIQVSGVGGTRLPQRGLGQVVGVGFGLAVLAAFSPPVAILALVLTLVWSMTVSGRWGNLARLAGVAVTPAALLWPWSGYLAANPGLLLRDIGVSNSQLLADLAMPWQLPLLDAGGPAAPPTGVGAFLLVLALVATFNRRTRSLSLLGWSVVLGGLILGTVQVVLPVTVPWSSVAELAWPGSATAVVAAGLIMVIVAAASFPTPGSSPQKDVMSEGADADDEPVLEFQKSPGVIAPSLALIGALIVGGWWVLDQEPLLFRGDAAAVSPFVATESLGPDAPRTILMSRIGRGEYAYELVSGAGPVLGDSEMAPTVASLSGVDEAVARLATGASSEDLQTLADAAVRYVQVETSGNRELSRQLDAVAGLSRVSTAGGQALWELQNWRPRAQLTKADGTAVPVPVSFGDDGAVVVDTEVADTTGLQSFTLSEASNPIWQATLDGASLTALPEAEYQTFEVPEGSSGPARLAASSNGETRIASLIVPGVVLAATALLGLIGLRRRRSDRKLQKRRGSAKVDPTERTPDVEEVSV